MFLFIVILSSVTAGLVIWWYYIFLKYSPRFSKYNGPPPVPILGNLYKILSSKDIIPVFMDYHKKYGPVIMMWFGFRPRLVISDYRLAELLLDSTTIVEKSYDYGFMKPWLGTGLLISTGKKWKRQRKLLTPTMHFQILQQYISIFHAQSEILVEKLRENISDDAVDVHPLIALCTLDIICAAAMGVEINAQKESNSDYVRSLTQMSRIIVNRMFSPFKMHDTLFWFSRDYGKQKRALAVLHNHTNFVIHSKQKSLDNDNYSIDSEDDFGIKKRTAFLDLLLQSRTSGNSHITLDNVREEVDTFMFAGHDTTTSAIEFVLYCLAQNMEVQDKVVVELRSIFDTDKHRTATYQELQDMKYLGMVIKECMRLYPPVLVFTRELFEDTQFDGAVFPKGTTLMMFTYGLHRQEEMFPDPEKFNPDRFTLETSAKRSPFAYVPFSAGIRNCIGQRFAMLELKSTIAKIVMNFQLLPVPGFKPILAVEPVLHSENGILIRFRERNL